MRTVNIALVGLCLIMAAACNQPAKESEMKNEVIENIMSRRSIRKYTAEPVSRETLMKIMECGINAPNGQNKQSWEVRIVDNTELLSQMSEAMGEAHGGN